MRYYPVYKGETEAQAYKRKIDEETAAKREAEAGNGNNFDHR